MIEARITSGYSSSTWRTFTGGCALPTSPADADCFEGSSALSIAFAGGCLGFSPGLAGCTAATTCGADFWDSLLFAFMMTTALPMPIAAAKRVLSSLKVLLSPPRSHDLIIARSEGGSPSVPVPGSIAPAPAAKAAFRGPFSSSALSSRSRRLRSSIIWLASEPACPKPMVR